MKEFIALEKNYEYSVVARYLICYNLSQGTVRASVINLGENTSHEDSIKHQLKA